jgi:hypothetical protein
VLLAGIACCKAPGDSAGAAIGAAPAGESTISVNGPPIFSLWFLISM